MPCCSRPPTLGKAAGAIRPKPKLIRARARADEGEGKTKMTLVMVHAQDHLMTSILCRELATELVEILIAAKPS